jgi:hypothetical protein
LLKEEEGVALLHLLLRRLPEQTVSALGCGAVCWLVVAGCTQTIYSILKLPLKAKL